MRKAKSLDANYFEELYRADPDPWKFQSSDYERHKYAHTLSIVSEEPVRRGFEMGCSIGVLTLGLAKLCDRLIATELSERALAQARLRCASQDNIEFVLARTTIDGIEGHFDLMLLSEVVYYWDDMDLAAVGRAVSESLAPGGRLVLVHWLGQTDYPKSADDAVNGLRRLVDDVTVVTESRTADYRLDVWRRNGGQPAAASVSD